MKPRKYTIRVISDVCGIKPQRLRMWERRYDIVDPERSDGGQRLYSQEDLEYLSVISKLVKVGFSISRLTNLTDIELKALYDEIDSKRVINDFDEVVTLIREYKIKEVEEKLNFFRHKLGAREFLFTIVLPVLRKIGEFTAEETINITQEHIVSNILRTQISRINLSNSGADHLLTGLGTPDGNYHDLNIQISQVLCHLNNIPTIFFGASNPAKDIALAINKLEINFLVLAVLSNDQWDYQRDIESYLLEVDQNLNRTVYLVLGASEKIKFPKFKNIEEIDFLSSFEELDDFFKELV